MENLPEKISSATEQAAQILCGHLLPRFRCLKFQGQIPWSEFKKEVEVASPEGFNLVDSAVYLDDVFKIVRKDLKRHGFDVLELNVDANIYSKRQLHYSAQLRAEGRCFWKNFLGGLLFTATVFLLAPALIQGMFGRSRLLVYED
jgi:hypothetical protein